MRRVIDGISLIFAIIIWEVLVRVFGGLIPAPSQLSLALVRITKEDQLLTHILWSASRVVFGVGAAIIFGFIAAVAATKLPLRGIIELLRPIPPIAWIPLVFIIFGSGELGCAFIIFLGTFFPFFSVVFYEISNVPKQYLTNCRSLRLSRFERWRHCIIPNAMPQMYQCFISVVGLGWMFVVVSEMIAAQSGLGYLIQIYRSTMQLDAVVALMMVIGFSGWLSVRSVALLQSIVTPWRYYAAR